MSLLNIRKRHRKPVRIVAIVLLILIGVAGWYLYNLYTSIFDNNVKNPDISVYVNEPLPLTAIADSLEAKDALRKPGGFRLAMNLMETEGTVPVGHYSLDAEMNSREIINMFKSGAETPVRVTIRKERLWEDLAEDVGRQVYFPPDSLMQYLEDSVFIQSLGFNKHTIMAMFLQDTYEVYWTIDARDFMERMKEEYNRYWTDNRKKKAEAQGLTPEEAITLASIVEEETVMPDERAKVAGLYLNRLEKGWKLQADPTIRFARKDFQSNRVLFKHFEVESKYNTYKQTGLPPGPICIPSKASIEAVLNPAEHEYLYMCAKPDFSGYHNFARTNAQHNRNRAAYLKALRERE